MNSKYRIKTISYYPLFIVMLVAFVVCLYSSVNFQFSRIEYVFTGIALIGFWFLMHYLFLGKFIAEINESNNLVITWTKKPFLTSKTDRLININSIMKAYKPTNLSWAPDKYIIEIKNEKNFSFFDPMFNNNKEFIHFQSVLNYCISIK